MTDPKEALEYYRDRKQPKRMTHEDILRERLSRITAIVDALEQHGDIDLTTLTQLRGALNWEPGKDGDTE